MFTEWTFVNQNWVHTDQSCMIPVKHSHVLQGDLMHLESLKEMRSYATCQHFLEKVNANKIIAVATLVTTNFMQNWGRQRVA